MPHVARAHARAALLQLPVPDARAEAARANVPLAPGYLAAAAASLRGSACSLLPRDLQDHGGDAAILAWLQGVEPDVVGFTTYLWNVERSLWLARELKARRPGTAVVFGGPEIAPGNPLLEAGAAPEVDLFVIGEGERVWSEILAGERALQGQRIIEGGGVDASRLADPYLSGALEARPGDSLFLETVRGCTRRCDYCYYAKASPLLRALPDSIAALLAYARERGVGDVYVMDPCFNASRDFRDKLRSLAAANTSRIPLHTELELEAVTAEVAELLREASFASVEAGLQSTNPAALRAVHRGWRREEFLRGASLLRERGIEVRTGIILGLPRDDMEGFIATIEFVKEHGLGDGVELYPLSVLPGTALRERAAGLDIAFMDRPPYWVLDNGAMREPDFVEAIELAEADLDVDFFQPALPRVEPLAKGLTSFRDLRLPGSAANLLEELRNEPQRLASRLCLLVAGPAPSEPGLLEAIGRRTREVSPHTLVQIVVECDASPPYPPWERIALRFLAPDHYFDRLHYYKTDAQGRFSVRLLHLTGDPAVVERAYTDPEAPPFDPLLRYSPALLDGGVLQHLPPLLLPGDLARGDLRELEARYRGLESHLVRVP